MVKQAVFSKREVYGRRFKKFSSNEFTGEIFRCTINACSGTKKIGEIKIHESRRDLNITSHLIKLDQTILKIQNLAAK